jgi:hypothetical protein
MPHPETVALRERLDAQATEIGHDALWPTVEEWQAYFAARDLPLDRQSLDVALTALAGTMSTLAQSVLTMTPEGRSTARRQEQQRVARLMDAVRLSAVALSQVPTEEES